MKKIKKFEEFVSDNGILETTNSNVNYDRVVNNIVELLEKSLKEEEKWKEIMQLDFEDLGITKKGNRGLKVDMRLDGFGNFEYSKHDPCVYFRVGEGEYDFLPMIISDTPYVPFTFEQTINDGELLWVYNWVKENNKILIDFANDKIETNKFYSSLKDVNYDLNYDLSIVNEGKTKIRKDLTGLSRTIWIGPYNNTGHYLRIKVETPKNSKNSNEWASLTIPDLELKPGIEQTDLKMKEKKALDKFALLNQEILDDFANNKIDLTKLETSIIKVNKKGNSENEEE